jgi:sugar/nucleoside kinase (ribokinase family)
VRIVCAGLATVDVVYRAYRIPGPDEKVQASSVEIAGGGPATNAAITAALRHQLEAARAPACRPSGVR